MEVIVDWGLYFEVVVLVMLMMSLMTRRIYHLVNRINDMCRTIRNGRGIIVRKFRNPLLMNVMNH